VALRGCCILNQYGWDLFAATSVAGRDLYASYALLWEILQHCQREGVKEYEMMGIDPIKNLGVANFKKGTGANLIEYLGEWEWATSRILGWGANLAVRWVRSNT
jgi:lipid II:glycine glycyltransferase (peptidoglycan interpeptide bridge formation enzyme)